MAANKPKTSQPQDTTKVSKVDVCQTPPHALEPLYPYIPKHWVIWESAVGPEKLIQKTFEAHGYTVIGTDLMYGNNYFDYAPENYDIQVTNMPFSIKYKWLKRAFELGKPFALLAPYETTFAKDWQKLFVKYNSAPYLIEVLSPERRINFKMPNMGWGTLVFSEEKGWYMRGESAQMPTCWITWGLHVSLERSDYLRTFYVPMRSVKYNTENQPIERKQHADSRKNNARDTKDKATKRTTKGIKE